MKTRITLCLLWLLAVAASNAQTFYGSVVGIVSDASGGAMPHAAVTLVNTGTADRRAMVTDETGKFEFVNLVPGQYRLEVEMTGFRRAVRDQIAVEVQNTVRLEIGMQVGEVTQTVEVTGQTPLLQTENA